MPDAIAGAHPLDATGRKNARLSRALGVLDRALEHDGDRGDARVRVPADPRHAPPLPVEVEVIEEHERLDELADVGRAHEPRDGSAHMSPRAIDDLAHGLLGLLKLIRRHDFVLLCP